MKTLLFLLLLAFLLFSCNDDDDCNCTDPPGSATPGVGQVIITEIMYNPAAVPDSDGEWFELFNMSTTETYVLTGLIIDINNDNPVMIS